MPETRRAALAALDAPALAARLDALPPLRAAAEGAARVLDGVPGGAVGLVAWWLRHHSGRNVLVVSPDPETAYTDATAWAGDEGVGLFPAGDALPFDRIPPGEEVTRRRLGVLSLLASGIPAIVVASPAGLLRPTLPVALVREGLDTLEAGRPSSRDGVIARLVTLGYRRETAVSFPGEFAVRGGILDVFPPDARRPWRAEWFGDAVEEIRSFEVETQTSVGRLDSVRIGPAREIDLSPEAVERALRALQDVDLSGTQEAVRETWERDRERLEAGMYDEGVDSFFPYLAGDPPPTLVDHLGDALVLYAGGAERVWRAAARHLEEVAALRAQEEQRGELPRDSRIGLADAGLMRAALEGMSALDLVPGEGTVAGAPGLGWHAVEAHAGRFDTFAAGVRARAASGRSTLVVSRQQGRVLELAVDAGLEAVEVDDLDAAATALPEASLAVAFGDLSEGFSAGAAGFDVYSDHELFGAVKRRGSLVARGARRAESTSARGARHAATGRAAQRAFSIEFEPGDLVVHRDHGIGRFVEMRRVEDESGGEHEYMALEYADGDRLYVPVAHLDRVDRYVGGADASPSLSRLGTGEWERAKRRVRERTEQVARELLALYSQRELAGGHAAAPDGAWQQELEASFPFEETPDQVMVMEEIKRDMEASRPMDRVVCGDVGFGKTELAVRAAFKAAVEGRQVAVLVPTTVLAQQHFSTFASRLRPFPITVGELSRFRTDEEIRDTLLGLQTGGVDVVIGTHRLLQKDVAFRNLGLVIIDEEQRFGVLQKERFKEMRVAVDVLSLSATPIPRTLHMSLAGIRDLSVIQTPPEERQPIRTFVTAYEEGLVREVVTRELARGGQVYYVHNRVRTIEREAEKLRRLLPDVSVEVAHGQMPERHLAEVMRRFTGGEIDVLCCTTIIESGLDIPNVNTIVVDDAHRFGLAQLYQLRGRVGRAGQRAYAYMLYPPQRSLTERADKRLDVVADLQQLGAGFSLAMRDLEIRGAGNLLGEEQHGEIAAVGLELYNHMLSQAVAEQRGRPLPESPAQVSVSLPLDALLPSAYITDEKLRLRCYQDLAACVSEAELDQRARGLVDRFGKRPPQAEALLYSLRVRLLAAAAGALAVEGRRDAITVQLPQQHGLDLLAVAAQFRSRASASATRVRLDITAAGRGAALGAAPRPADPREWQPALLQLLRELGRLVRAREAVPA